MNMSCSPTIPPDLLYAAQRALEWSATFPLAQPSSPTDDDVALTVYNLLYPLVDPEAGKYTKGEGVAHMTHLVRACATLRASADAIREQAALLTGEDRKLMDTMAEDYHWLADLLGAPRLEAGR